MSLTDHVQFELERIPDETASLRVKAAIVELAAATVDQYDSGGSAPYGAAIVADLFKRSFLYEPLTPIEDRPEDWVDVHALGDGRPAFQHRRYSALFKDGEDGRPYALDRVVWKELRLRRPYRDLGESAFPPVRVYSSGFTGWDSKRYVGMPWKPTEPRRVWHRFRWVVRLWARATGSLVTV